MQNEPSTADERARWREMAERASETGDGFDPDVVLLLLDEIERPRAEAKVGVGERAEVTVKDPGEVYPLQILNDAGESLMVLDRGGRVTFHGEGAATEAAELFAKTVHDIWQRIERQRALDLVEPVTVHVDPDDPGPGLRHLVGVQRRLEAVFGRALVRVVFDKPADNSDPIPCSAPPPDSWHTTASAVRVQVRDVRIWITRDGGGATIRAHLTGQPTRSLRLEAP